MLVVLLVAAVAVGWGSWRYAALRRTGATETLLTAVLVFVATESGSVLLVGGALRQLRAWTLLVTAGAFAASALLVSRPVHRRRLVAERRAAVRAAARSGLRTVRGHPVLAVLLLLVAGQYVWRLLLALRFPMMDFDGLWYHLTTVDVWHQYHAVTRVRANIWSDAYPATSETVTAWLVVLRGSDSVATLTQFQFVLLGGLAVLTAARRAGLAVGSALFAALLFAATPIVFVQAATGEVDVAEVAVLVTAWYLVVTTALDRRPRLSSVLLAGAAVGLTAGVKSSGLLAATVIVVGGVVIAVRSRPHGRGLGWWAAAAGCLAVPFLGFGGWWYVSDWIAHANPLYPLAFDGFAGVRWATYYVHLPAPHHAGAVAALVESWTHDLGWHPFGTTSRLGGFGAQFLILLVLAAAGAVVLFRSRPRRPLLWLTAVPTALLFAVYPDRWVTRYVIFLAVAVVLLAAVALDRLRPTPRALLQTVVVVATAFSMAAATYFPNTRFHTGTTAGDVWRAMWSPASTRDNLGWWGYYRSLSRLPDGTILVPPDVNRLPYPPIFLAPLAGLDFDQRIVATATEPTAADVLPLLRLDHAGYLLVYSRSALDGVLARDPAFDPLLRVPDAVLYGLETPDPVVKRA